MVKIILPFIGIKWLNGREMVSDHFRLRAMENGLRQFMTLSEEAFGWLPEPSWARGRGEGVPQK